MTLIECNCEIPVLVTAVDGGQGFRLRLQNLGIGVGQELTKVHSHPFRGPITVRVKTAQVAVGHGMAGRIHVESIP